MTKIQALLEERVVFVCLFVYFSVNRSLEVFNWKQNLSKGHVKEWNEEFKGMSKWKCHHWASSIHSIYILMRRLLHTEVWNVFYPFESFTPAEEDINE